MIKKMLRNRDRERQILLRYSGRTDEHTPTSNASSLNLRLTELKLASSVFDTRVHFNKTSRYLSERTNFTKTL